MVLVYARDGGIVLEDLKSRNIVRVSGRSEVCAVVGVRASETGSGCIVVKVRLSSGEVMGCIDVGYMLGRIGLGFDYIDISGCIRACDYYLADGEYGIYGYIENGVRMVLCINRHDNLKRALFEYIGGKFNTVVDTVGLDLDVVTNAAKLSVERVRECII